MKFLEFLEGIRTPFLDTFFSLITHLGEETFFMLIGLIFFWCISKKQGYYVLFVGLFGTVVNQFLKLLFRIPRPWVLNENLTIVESARAEAGGYSFPSGHTQSSLSTFGAAAVLRKEKWIKIVSVLICLLVPFSRMYLGVHTPLDVGVSFIITVAMLALFYYLINWAMEKPIRMRLVILTIAALTLAYLLFVEFYSFPADIDLDNYESGLKNGYKMLGCFLGLYLTYEIETRFIKFETAASFPVQVLKVVLGLIPVLLIKTFLKQPLISLCGNAFLADGIRYFLIAAFAGCVWPLSFKVLKKLEKNSKK